MLSNSILAAETMRVDYYHTGDAAQENVMPAFGDNPNVACYMDDLYVYLRARSNEAWGRTRPGKHEDKNDAYTKNEDSCMGKK